MPKTADLMMAAAGSPCVDWSPMGLKLGTEGRTMVAFVVMFLVRKSDAVTAHVRAEVVRSGDCVGASSCANDRLIFSCMRT